MINKRDVALAIILTILTCGIYGIYWFIVLTDDAKEVSGDQDLPSGIASFLFSILTCGIFSIYWAYKMGEIIKNAQQKNNLKVNDYSILYMILEFLKFGIINYALMQNDLNIIADKKA